MRHYSGCVRACYIGGFVTKGKIRQLVCAALVVAGAAAQEPEAVPKVLGLFGDLQSAQQKYHPVKFELTEQEINDYSKYALRTTPRPGMRSFEVKVFPANYVSTFTVVDFDAIEKWKPGTVPAVLKPVLSGQRTIWLDIRFQASGGKVSFTVEKAYFESIRLPAFFVKELMQVVASRQPEHYDLSKPVPLAFGLKRVWSSGHSVFGEN